MGIDVRQFSVSPYVYVKSPGIDSRGADPEDRSTDSFR